MTAVMVPGFSVPEVPIGTVFDFLGTVAPEKYLLLDGSAVSRTTYSALFSLIGTTWGAGDGSTTFNLPDTRGKVSVGVGTGAGLTARSLGDAGGEETHVLTVGELASHTHTVSYNEGGATTLSTVGVFANAGGAVHTPATSGAGSNNPHNNMQPFNVFARIVRAL